MRIFQFIAALTAGLVISTVTIAQNKTGVDSTGLPGDNFSLQGALAMFQKASSPEDFEKLLNSEDNHISNLDLNNDGEIDYIRVIDNSEKDAHAFVLQAVISEKESQDVAVIELEKTGDTTAILQIIGDEDIYGDQVIVEPGDEGDEEAYLQDQSQHRIARGPNNAVEAASPRVVVNVWYWPSVRFIYAPSYRPWRSPWRWHHYPGWWRPWRPLAWHVWHPLHRPYYAHFGIVRTHRVVRAHRIYAPHRVTSVTVRARHGAAVGTYKVNRARTRTKTKINGPRGTKTKTTIRRH